MVLKQTEVMSGNDEFLHEGPGPDGIVGSDILHVGPAQRKQDLGGPEVSFQDPVHVLVEWPGSVVSRPVVVVAIRVGEKVAGQ